VLSPRAPKISFVYLLTSLSMPLMVFSYVENAGFLEDRRGVDHRQVGEGGQAVEDDCADDDADRGDPASLVFSSRSPQKLPLGVAGRVYPEGLCRCR